MQNYNSELGILVSLRSNYESLIIFACVRRTVIDNIKCMGIRVTKMMGSRHDDWIYWHFGYKFS
jgi:hypothetical protein